MKQIFTLLFTVYLGTSIFSQWTDKGFTFETLSRTYRVYVPANYNPSNPASLVFTLHGLGDDMYNFSNIGMDNIADTANIILVCPQAIVDGFLGSSAWNSGAGYTWFSPNATVNDVGFINALIDSVSSEYAINLNKIFSCGFSMGGFMTERLALESNTRIKSFASVAGTFGNAILPAQNPGRAVSIAHFHGTADSTIFYTGNTWGNDVDALMDFWVQNNHCNAAPVQTNLADISNDGYTVQHLVYSGGDNNTLVELFKVNGANHTWLTQGNDIDYAVEIWKFFNRSNSMTTSLTALEKTSFEVYPNPTQDKITISLKSNHSVSKISILDALGREVLSFNSTLVQDEYLLDLSGLKVGIYTISLQGDDLISNQKIILN